MTSSGGSGRSSSKSRPRYAPEDPSLPKPWKALVDGSTGYVYYWNTETNLTQYERPELPPPPPPPPPPHMPPRSAVHQSRDDRRGREDHRREEERGREDHRRDDRRDERQRSAHQPGGERGGTGHGHGHSTKDLRDVRTTSSRSQGGLLDAGGSSISVEAYRRQNEIIVTGDNVPAPYMTFESAGFPQEILKEVHYAGFTSPTPIQAQSWPVAMQSRDIVAIAKTGSGKTLGYLIPGFVHLKRTQNNPKMGPTVLILAPTRELATQIQVEAVKFGRSSRISCTCLYGGAPKGPQLRDLDRGVDVVVATPGRLNDILEMRRISLLQVSYLVLDEADRMLDMGFEPQIRKIVKDIPHRRQTLMFTATWPKEVRKIAADLLIHPVQVNIGRTDELVANNSITQHVEVITPMEKLRRLEQILRSQDPGSKVIIFCSTKKMCDNLSRLLARQFSVAVIHGDKSQTERDRVLSHFRSGRSPILVATDVAARGLDIKDIRVVINYDFPTGVEDYVHRIGRTGRAGATGVSYTFFCEQDSKYAADLVKILEGANQRVPKELKDMVLRGGYGGKSRRWGSVTDSRNGGRFNAARNDATLGSRAGRTLPSLSGRPDSWNGHYVLNTHEPSRDRYDRGQEYGQRVDVQENRSRGRVQGRSRSRSRSRSHSRNRQHSHSPKRGRAEQMRSKSPSKNRDHVRNQRSRSRSRSASRGYDNYGANKQVGNPKSPPSRKVHSPSDPGMSYPDNSQMPYSPELRKAASDDLNKENADLIHSSNPRNPLSGSPSLKDSERLQQWREISPRANGNSRESEEHNIQLPTMQKSRNYEEDEEGMIPADEEEGAILAEEEGRSPDMVADNPASEK